MSSFNDQAFSNSSDFNVPGSFKTSSRSRNPNDKVLSPPAEYPYQGRIQAHRLPNNRNQQQHSEPNQYLPSSKNSHSTSTVDPNQSLSSTRFHARSKSHSNFLKLIPPMPSDPQGTETRNLSKTQQTKYSNANYEKDTENVAFSTGSTKETQMSSFHNSKYTPPTSATNSPSVCAKCQKPITTKSVKALGRRYHTQCFGCADCGTPILSKYFPFETSQGDKIPLCEEHFYERRGLICCVCNSFLKGTHYTVFGRKYDAEHFCCKICNKKFETDEDFFNHEDGIYCHYHFSKFFIERCDGCEFAILKQYVEIFRGGKNQKWHVECYMIHKCWNVAIGPASIGIAPFPKVEPTEANIKNSLDTNPTPEELLIMESKVSEKISEVWNTLFKFEEDTATCISNMLQFTSAKDQQKGLEATAKLVFKIDALFKALDGLHRLGIDPTFTGATSFDRNKKFEQPNQVNSLKKEPRNLSAKIMVYLAILRKVSKGLTDSSSSQDLLLSVVTGLAHYLKSLIRYGLNSGLQYNKNSHTTSALDKFLREIRNHDLVSSTNVFNSLDVPVNASDLCYHCEKSIESECVQYQDKRWHVSCVSCTSCHKNLQETGGISDASFNSEKKRVLCSHCALDDPNAKPGFKAVSKLLQLSYLLKIAIVRSKAVMEFEIQNGMHQRSPSKVAVISEQNYLKTLNDIKRLRSTRQNTKVTVPTTTKENSRRSIIVETADNLALRKTDPIAFTQNPDQQFSEEELISRQKITVEDEPLGPTQMSKNSFNRAANFINSQKVLTLDDIPRIVAAEHARELRPNTYKFHNPHQQEELSKEIKSKSNSINRNTSTRDLAQNKPKRVSTRYYSELNDTERFVIQHLSAVILKHILPNTSGGEGIDPTKLFELKKNPSFWDKLRGLGNNEKRNLSVNKVFGSDLNDLTKKTGVESSQTNGPCKVKIPLLMDELLTALYQKDMSVEGVFRKNGNLKTLRELTEAVDATLTKVPPLDEENAVQLSALLKRFLREMPNPLLTFSLYDLWILSQKTKDSNLSKLFIELSYSLLPKAHRDLSEVLFFFFMWASSFSHIDEQSGSKMDIHNLATVLSPNILYAKPSEVSRPVNNKGVAAATYYDAFGENEGENYYLAIEVVDYLITHHEELSVVPRYLLELYELGNFQTLDSFNSKDLFARIETLVAAHPDVFKSIIAHTSNGFEEEGESASGVEESDAGMEALNTTYD